MCFCFGLLGCELNVGHEGSLPIELTGPTHQRLIADSHASHVEVGVRSSGAVVRLRVFADLELFMANC